MPVPDYEFLTGLGVDSATNTVYATSSALGNEHILVISGADDEITDTISPFPGGPSAITVNQDTDVFYALNATTGESLSAYSGATNALLGTATFTGEDPSSIAANTATDTEYVDATDDSDSGLGSSRSTAREPPRSGRSRCRPGVT